MRSSSVVLAGIGANRPTTKENLYHSIRHALILKPVAFLCVFVPVYVQVQKALCSHQLSICRKTIQSYFFLLRLSLIFLSFSCHAPRSMYCSMKDMNTSLLSHVHNTGLNVSWNQISSGSENKPFIAILIFEQGKNHAWKKTGKKKNEFPEV